MSIRERQRCSISLPILTHKLNQRRIHFLRMAKAQEMLSTLYSLQLGIGTVDKHLDLLFRILDTIPPLSASPYNTTSTVRRDS